MKIASFFHMSGETKQAMANDVSSNRDGWATAFVRRLRELEPEVDHVCGASICNEIYDAACHLPPEKAADLYVRAFPLSVALVIRSAPDHRGPLGIAQDPA
jgi:hypothetical protein